MSPLEALAHELGAVAARIDRETSLRLDAALSDLKRSTAEFDLRFERLERTITDRLATVKDGDSVTAADVAPMIDEAVRAAVSSAAAESRSSISTEIAELVAAIPPAEPGKSAEPSAVADILREGLEQRIDALVTERMALIEVPVSTIDDEALATAARAAVAEIPPPKDGVTLEEIAPVIAEQVAKAVSEIKLPDAPEPLAVDMEAVGVIVIEAVKAAASGVPERIRSDVAAMVAAKVEEAVASIPSEIEKAVAALPPAEPGASVTLDDVAPMIAEQVSKAVAELPPAEPGKSVTIEEVAPLILSEVEKAVSAIPPAEPGKSVTLEEALPALQELVERVVADLPPAEPGKSVTVEEVEPLLTELVGKAVAAIPAPKNGKDGKLPVVKAWEDRVYYEGDVCTHDGATYQASVDTGRAPHDSDWTCIAAKGENGIDADQIEPEGTFDPNREYRRLSVVMLNGASFIAKTNNPGPCPGEGWKLFAQQGKPGKPGEVKKADRGTKPTALQISEEGILTLQTDDGTVVECDLYPLLSRL